MSGSPISCMHAPSYCMGVIIHQGQGHMERDIEYQTLIMIIYFCSPLSEHVRTHPRTHRNACMYIILYRQIDRLLRVYKHTKGLRLPLLQYTIHNACTELPRLFTLYTYNQYYICVVMHIYHVNSMHVTCIES